MSVRFAQGQTPSCLEKCISTGGGGGTPRIGRQLLPPTNRWPEATQGLERGGSGRGFRGKGSGRVSLGEGEGPGGAIWGVLAPHAKCRPIRGSPYLPLPPSNHTII